MDLHEFVLFHFGVGQIDNAIDVHPLGRILEVVSIVEKYPCNLGPINSPFKSWA